MFFFMKIYTLLVFSTAMQLMMFLHEGGSEFSIVIIGVRFLSVLWVTLDVKVGRFSCDRSSSKVYM